MAELICRRCKQPVTVNKERYEVFEGMHWLCFHLEYEHTIVGKPGNYDPDEPCEDPDCPWNVIKVREEIIKNNNLDLEKELKKYWDKKWGK